MALNSFSSGVLIKASELNENFNTLNSEFNNYLPLSAGESKSLTGSLYINNGGYSSVELYRTVNDVDYHANVGIGITPSCSLELWEVDKERVNRADLTSNGFILHKGYVTAPDGLHIDNSKYIYAKDKDGTYRNIFGLNSSNNIAIGYDMSGVSGSQTMVYGNTVYLKSNAQIYFTPSNGTGGYISVQYSSSDKKNIIMPSTSGGAYNGASTYRWQGIYTVNAVNVSSDRRLKKDISYDFSKYDYLIDTLKPVHYKLIDDEGEKTHFGFIAQDIEDTLIESDLDSNHIALLTKDNVDENSDLAKILDNKISYGLGYTEIIALNTVANQKNKEEINSLKEQAEAQKKENEYLKSEISSLKNQLTDILNKLNI